MVTFQIFRTNLSRSKAATEEVVRSGVSLFPRMVDIRLPGKGNSPDARPVHPIITMIKWIWTSRLSIENSLSLSPG